MDELDVIRLRVFLLVSHVRSIRKYCVHSKNYSWNFDEFTRFQQPWIWKSNILECHLSLYTYALYKCLYICMYICLYVRLANTWNVARILLWFVTSPPVTPSLRVECNDMIIACDMRCMWTLVSLNGGILRLFKVI
jgi:hypothetical protein